MKELSIEEKAKRYDDVREKIAIRFGSNVAKEIFSEYEESEDEKIRKALINGFNKLDKSAVWYNGITNGQILAWLEKQGEHAKFTNGIQVGDKVTRNEDGVLVNLSQLNRVAKKQGEQKPVVIIPKFRVGDEIKTSNEESLTITKIDEKGYWSEDLFICDFDDAVAWDLVEQKSSWSEEDEINLEKAIWYVGNPAPMVVKDSMLVEWLKSLKVRMQPQPKQEWSEKDERIKNNLLSELTNLSARKLIEKETEKKYASWLKSIRPQWKPSEEMLEALYRAIPENVMEISEDEMLLDKLYQGLKYGRVLSNK